MKCPSCGRAINAKKYEVVNCSCGKKLIIIEINKIKQVVDVTPKEER